jgi:hypothetical protein
MAKAEAGVFYCKSKLFVMVTKKLNNNIKSSSASLV